MEEADAHECLSALLDAMHEGSLASLKDKPPPQELADTFVHRIFGGLTKTEVSLFPPVNHACFLLNFKYGISAAPFLEA